MNFNILYEFRLDSIFSYILSIILIFYIFKNTPIPNNLDIDSDIKKVLMEILSDISLARFKRKGKLNSTDLFILTHKKSKQYGINIVSQEMT